ETLPKSVHLFIVSRDLPKIEYAVWLKPREHRVLSDRDLAFSFRETEAFLRKNGRIDLTREELQKVHRITRGWIGGLVLLCDALSAKHSRSGRSLLSGGPSAGFQTTVNRYFDEAVFEVQPRAVQDFLLKISVLDEFDMNLLGHLFPDADNEGIIQSLIDRN